MRPIVLAVPPLYVPEKVRVESVAVRLAKFEPREIPEMVELARPALLKVPLRDGVKVWVSPAEVMVIAAVRPLKEEVEVARV